MPKRELQITDAERQRRRDNMKRLREQGKVGPQFGHLGGRPRKPRATELVAEEAKKHAESIAKVFIDGINDDSMKTRLAAANSWLGLEQEEAKLQLQEEKHEIDIGNASRDELIGFLANALTSGPISDQIGSIIDGTAEEIGEDFEHDGRDSTSDNGSSS